MEKRRRGRFAHACSPDYFPPTFPHYANDAVSAYAAINRTRRRCHRTGHVAVARNRVAPRRAHCAHVSGRADAWSRAWLRVAEACPSPDHVECNAVEHSPRPPSTFPTGFSPLASSPPSSFSLFLLPFASHLLSRYNILYACFPSFPSTCPLACTHERLSTRSGRGRNWRESWETLDFDSFLPKISNPSMNSVSEEYVKFLKRILLHLANN